MGETISRDTGAKTQLLSDLYTLGEHKSLKVSRRRRESVSMCDLELNDIVTILTYVDENNFKLPQ